MLDTSTNIGGEANFKLCLEFMVSVYEYIGVSASIRFSFIRFGSKAEIVFDFSKYTSITEIKTAVMGITMIGGSCKAGVALSAARELFGGARKDVSRILLLLFAGKSEDSVNSQAEGLKGSGVKIVGVGLENYDKEQLGVMVTSASYILSVSAYAQLSSMTSQCGGLIIQGNKLLLVNES